MDREELKRLLAEAITPSPETGKHVSRCTKAEAAFLDRLPIFSALLAELEVAEAENARLKTQPMAKCKANRSSDPPQDCDWPYCGCDEHAEKVVESMIECGWQSPREVTTKDAELERLKAVLEDHAEVFDSLSREMTELGWRNTAKALVDLAAEARVIAGRSALFEAPATRQFPQLSSPGLRGAREVAREQLGLSEKQKAETGVRSSENIERMAKAICAETCTFMGEQPCWQIRGDKGEKLPWPAEACSEPGCMALAQAAIAAISPRQQPGMISADRACEIVGALREARQDEPIRHCDIEEAINTIRMEAERSQP